MASGVLDGDGHGSRVDSAGWPLHQASRGLGGELTCSRGFPLGRRKWRARAARGRMRIETERSEDPGDDVFAGLQGGERELAKSLFADDHATLKNLDVDEIQALLE